jgi:hypothetical protein
MQQNQNIYVGNPNSGGRPNNNLVISIIGTVLCWPIGLFGLLKAVKVNTLWAQGNYAQAHEAARSARTLGIISIIVGAVFNVLTFIGVIIMEFYYLDMMDDDYYEYVYDYDYEDDYYYY